jgi:hypothetical protein
LLDDPQRHDDLANDPADLGSKFTLSSPFAPTAGVWCAKGSPHVEWLEKSAHRIERAARLCPPELMAVIGGAAVFLGLVMDVDLPFAAASEE